MYTIAFARQVSWIACLSIEIERRHRGGEQRSRHREHLGHRHDRGRNEDAERPGGGDRAERKLAARMARVSFPRAA